MFLVHLIGAIGVKSNQLVMFLAIAWSQKVKAKVDYMLREGHFTI